MSPVPARLRRGIAVMGALVLLAGCSSTEQRGPAEVVNQGYQSGDGSVRTWPADDRSAPLDLSGTTYADAEIDLADWRGDVVVLNTWFAACPPCRAEAPLLVDIATQGEIDGVHVLGINRTDDAGAALAFERTYDVPYPSIDDRSGQATSALEGVVPVQATPTTVVLDKQGRVAARVLGTLDESTITTIIDDVRAEPAAGSGA